MSHELIARTVSGYTTEALAVRTHLRVRLRLFDFSLLINRLPQVAPARILDVGCGHGFLALLLSQVYPKAGVTGIDPDRRKIAIAQRANEALGLNARFIEDDVRTFQTEKYDLITWVDSLYLLPFEEQRDALDRIAGSLTPDGTLMLKETQERPRWKAEVNRLQETLSVRLFGFSQGQGLYLRSRRGWLSLLDQVGLEGDFVDLDAGKIHPHILFTHRPRKQFRKTP